MKPTILKFFILVVSAFTLRVFGQPGAVDTNFAPPYLGGLYGSVTQIEWQTNGTSLIASFGSGYVQRLALNGQTVSNFSLGNMGTIQGFKSRSDGKVFVWTMPNSTQIYLLDTNGSSTLPYHPNFDGTQWCRHISSYSNG